MKKIILSLLALSMLCLATISNAKSIRIGTEGAYPPWNNLNSAGELEGAEIDFGNEACKRMAVDCEWITQDWDGILPALLKNLLFPSHFGCPLVFGEQFAVCLLKNLRRNHR